MSDGDGLSGLRFGPATALANDLSTNPCTAQDVEIIGAGFVLNEPCVCSGGTFDATVQFTVRNNTSTGRYCIALHLPEGFGVPGQDVILRDGSGSSTAPGKSGGESFHDTIMFGTVTGFPCNPGGTLVCIGSPGVTSGKCDPNTCTTIAWNTSPNAAGCTTADQKPPGGQCRHQQVCIQGFGVSLACVTNCPPSCGGAATLRACVSAAASQAPFTYTLTGSDGSSQSFGPTNDTCHDFQVQVTTTTTYTVRVSDKNGCFREASLTLTVTPAPKPTLAASPPDCSGKTTLTASPAGLANYTFNLDGTTINNGTSNTLTLTLTPGDHTVTVTITTSEGCQATSNPIAIHVNQPVSVSLNAGSTADCTGHLTFTAAASGGTGSYTFTWAIDGTTVSGNSGPTLAYPPRVDCNPHVVAVTATDSAGCPSGNTATRTVTQVVTTTVV
jgi:hypothetical protein